MADKYFLRTCVYRIHYEIVLCCFFIGNCYCRYNHCLLSIEFVITAIIFWPLIGKVVSTFLISILFYVTVNIFVDLYTYSFRKQILNNRR